MEKTFEELVNDIHYDITNSFRKDDILKLLQQVREATIDECLQLATKETIMSRKSQFDLIPTDRIKITE